MLRVLSHAGTLHEEEGLLLAKGSCGGLRLAALVEPSSHVVRKAAHSGEESDVDRGLLEMLCAILEGRPILDGSDHGVIYLENRLRDRSQPPPVPGIVAPENADPAFATPLRLVRSLLADYREKTDYRETQNGFRPPISPAWRGMTPQARLDHVRREISASSSEDGVTALGFDGMSQLIVEFTHEMTSDEKQERLMKLECLLQEKVESTLQLHLQPKGDENSIRNPRGVR